MSAPEGERTDCLGLTGFMSTRLEPVPFRWNRNGALDSCFDAFSSREPASTSLESALAPAILRHAVEGLGEALQRERVGGLGALGGDALDRHVGGLAHGLDHAIFLGGVLDPEVVALSVH